MTAPVDGGVSPHRTRNSVDLPAPFGPSRAVTPGSTLNDTSDTATSDPNDFDTWSTTTVAVGEKTGGAEGGGGRGDRPGPGASAGGSAGDA